MKQFKYSDDYYYRECFLKREQVPTQSVMKGRMRALAPVYYKLMTPKLKVLAGLEPPMKGGGTEWFMHPDDLLAGRAVLKPVAKEHLDLLGFDGIVNFGGTIVQAHNNSLIEERKNALINGDNKWKAFILATCKKKWDDISKVEAQKNTENIMFAIQEFSMIYATSINQIQDTLMDAAVKQINRVREGVYIKMKNRLDTMVKQQSTDLYNLYSDMLNETKARLKADTKRHIDEIRQDLSVQLHDINVEKHTAVEKLRNLLECQNLACQVYVSLKEQEECKKEIELSKHEHKKKMKILKEQLAMREFELQLEIEKEKKRQEFNNIWKTKICHVVKKFQIFVKYCLHLLPEQGEFFVNMEKLMLLQLSEASGEPSKESLFEPEPELRTPQPDPHPMYLFREPGFKPDINKKLCAKHCTSSASQLPVVILNNRCIYPCCDNIEVFTEKVTRYLQGDRGDDEDLVDDHEYKYDVPVKYNVSQQILDLKLESSIMQILQKDLPNVRELPIECCYCKIPYCFCSPLTQMEPKLITEVKESVVNEPSIHSLPSGVKIETRSVELEFDREPKWESYMDFVKPKKCVCAKTAKKHLKENLPPYMWRMSKYDHPEMPNNYEPCSLSMLRQLVRQAKGKRTPPPPPPVIPPKTMSVGTQYEDEEFKSLCNCFSEAELPKMFEALVKGSTLFKPDNQRCEVVDGSVPPHLTQTASSFATKRAYSLRNMLRKEPELEEIFMKADCDFK